MLPRSIGLQIRYGAKNFSQGSPVPSQTKCVSRFIPIRNPADRPARQICGGRSTTISDFRPWYELLDGSASLGANTIARPYGLEAFQSPAHCAVGNGGKKRRMDRAVRRGRGALAVPAPSHNHPSVKVVEESSLFSPLAARTCTLFAAGCDAPRKALEIRNQDIESATKKICLRNIYMLLLADQEVSFSWQRRRSV
jgi:hypothetical protein